MKNYSFIIPHRNSPSLLNRCLNSIPRREDIEIIVVDDNSDADKCPQVVRNDVKIIYIDAKNTKGAGRARNFGLSEAVGRWIIFADCDDFYEDKFIEELDKYKNSNFDIIIWDYYNFFEVVNGTWENSPANLYMKALKYEPNNTTLQKAIKFSVNAPWNKMYNSSFVRNNRFQYEEIPKCNDAFFSMSAVEKAKKVVFINKRLYYYVKTDSGITQSKKKTDILGERSKANIIKMRNHAWGAIVPFHSGLKTIVRKHGLLFSIYYVSKNLFNGIPWPLVYIQKFYFIRKANMIIKRNECGKNNTIYL